jgi:gamma-glutamyl hercynylcysteine S-oxide synthase
MTRTTSAVELNRAALLDRFQRIRARTRALFDLLDDDAYYERPIALRNPIVFYEGHLPAFAVNTLIKRGLGEPGVDEQLETIFARGIDPATEAAAVARGNPAWPTRQVVRDYAAAADRLLADVLAHADLVREDRPLLRRAQAAWAILEHEEMHQETLAYMWHHLPYGLKRAPAGYRTETETTSTPMPHRVQIPAGHVTLGTSLADEPFAWDNELPPHVVRVERFAIDAFNVTNAQFLEFVDVGGYRDPRWWRPQDWACLQEASMTHPPFWEHHEGTWHWRGQFERVPLPASWPVYVTWAEANAYARWAGGRLPTEPEFHRAAFGTPEGDERSYPWGEAPPSNLHGNFDFSRWDPVAVGSLPAGVSAFGVHDLVGNGWEWTATVFDGFAGFTPLPSYPEYSADFFDGEHFVMKGASPATARELVRRGFRNWFRPNYPYVYATFRCVR